MQEGPIGFAAGGGAAEVLAIETADGRDGAQPVDRDEDDGSSHRGVAILLGAAAITAAIVGALAAGHSSDASDAWNSAVRLDLKRATAAIEEVRYLYQAEFPQAVTVMSAREQAAAYSAAASADPANAPALTIAAGGQANAASAMEQSVPLVSDSKYALPDGGVDLARRLSDLRNENADMVAIDPGAAQALGDSLAAKSGWLVIALIPLGLCALLGTLAQAFRGSRTVLLLGGSVLLGVGVIAAVAAEVLA
jgi:hypothetical protein